MKGKILPVNALYLSWLRDKGAYNRPPWKRVNKETGEVREINHMHAVHMLIYIMLLSRADTETLTCFPSINTICNDCMGIDRRVVWECLKDLEDMGFIKIEKSRGRPNVYHMIDFKKWRDNQK